MDKVMLKGCHTKSGYSFSELNIGNYSELCVASLGQWAKRLLPGLDIGSEEIWYCSVYQLDSFEQFPSVTLTHI